MEQKQELGRDLQDLPQRVQKRFAWIKAKRIDPAVFYEWSAKARKKKDACEQGELTLAEFQAWLKQS
ncbi:hypothetical protein [Flavonifractor sp. An82]|uniref:hypothetical protein n=1 Tax=Flavonifractor sp. An82 TaxID=1965660 RepID=UPI001FA92C95|nr:hypothetical protein [Flavonifractor sp. An82]